MLKKLLKIILYVLLALFIISSLVPYFIPVTESSDELKSPYENSFYEEINNVRIHCRLWKPLDTQFKGKILLVHGLGGSTFSWRNNVQVLAEQGYLVLAVDLPGFGYSDRERGLDHSQENRSKLLWQVLNEVDQSLDSNIKTGKWDLAGHSMGAGTVTAMALENPGRTRCVVYVDGAVLSSGNSFGFIYKYPPLGRWIEVLGRNVFFNEAKIKEFLSTAYGREPEKDEVNGYLLPFQLAGTEGSFVDMIKTSTQIKEDKLTEIKVPVHAIWGEKDTWVGIDNAYKLQNIIIGMDLKVIPGACHCAMETHSEIFNQYLLDALA